MAEENKKIKKNKNEEERRLLTKVDYTDENKTHLVFEYNDGTKDSPYEIQKARPNEDLRYIEREINGKKLKMKLIEDADYFNSHIEEMNDFSNAIFLEEINFNGSYVTIHSGVNFSRSIFVKKVILSNITFESVVGFGEAEFFDSVKFSYVSFFRNLGFGYAKFNNDTLLSLEHCVIKEWLFFNDVSGSFILNFKSTPIENMDYLNSNIEKAKNRETFLALKSLALNKNDNISALTFHTREYNKHYETLRWLGNFGDKLILWFEKIASYYGTKWWLPVFWIIFLLLIYLALEVCFWEQSNNIKDYLSNLNLLNLFRNPDEYNNSTHFVFEFFKNILLSILLYETIKSFRKFSRKL